MTTIYGGSVYPTDYDSFSPALVDNVDEVMADHPNTALEAVENIEGKLGKDGDPITGLGGVSFDAAGMAANPGAVGVPTLWVDNTAPNFKLKYTDELGTTAILAEGFWDRSGGVITPKVSTDRLRMSGGTVSLPGFAFNDSTGSGLRYSGGTVGISVAGTEAAGFASQGIRMKFGSATWPCIAGVSAETYKTGLYWTNYTLNVAANESQVAYFDANGLTLTQDTLEMAGGSTRAVQSTSGNLTVQTVTSGTLWLKAAGALNINGVSGVLLDSNANDISFIARGAAAITFNQAGKTDLSEFTDRSVIGALKELKADVGAVTLDQAYDGGGSGAGRSITADSDPVKITVPGGTTNAGLEIEVNEASQPAIQLTGTTRLIAALASGSVANDLEIASMTIDASESQLVVGSSSISTGAAKLRLSATSTGGGSTELRIQSDDELQFTANASGYISFNTITDPTLSGFTKTSIVGALNELKSEIGSVVVTLDSAYDYTGSGAGRSITADSGAVQITAAGNSALNLVQNDANAALDIGGTGSRTINSTSGALTIQTATSGVLNLNGIDGVAIYAASGEVSINGSSGIDMDGGAGTWDASSLSLTSTTFFDIAAGATSDLSISARGQATYFNQSGDESLSGFTKTSIIGALNELKSEITAESLWNRSGTVLSPQTAGDTIQVGAGAVGAPGVAIGSANDGLYQVVAGQVGFSSGGTQVFSYDAGGIVLSGGSSIERSGNIFVQPTGSLFLEPGTNNTVYIQKAGTGNALEFTGAATSYSINATSKPLTIKTTTSGLLTFDGASGVNIVGNAGEIDLTTSGAVDINSGAGTWDASSLGFTAGGNIIFDANGMVDPLPLNDGTTKDLSGFTATTLIGVLNELKSEGGAWSDTADVAIAAGDVVCADDTNTTGKLSLADNNVSGKDHCVGICIVGASAGGSAIVKTSGKVTVTSAASQTWACGDPIYLDATAGRATNVAPTSGTRLLLGHARGDTGTSHTLYLNIGERVVL